jgi:ubiquinone/menaquinone biosynthesis C-methylase UbiE
MTLRDADTFLELQTQTGWGRTLAGFAAWCQAQPGWRVLDVGCGPGLLPALFARQGCNALGLDLEADMFLPQPLHPQVLVAHGEALPFPGGMFDLVTASNLLFLLADPRPTLDEMRRVARPGGMLALLNPSEYLNQDAAVVLAEGKALQGLARASLLNWAQRAEANHRWTEPEMNNLLLAAGIQPLENSLKVGPGFARFTRGGV